MPFRSESQRRYLYAKEPEVAKRWTEKYGSKIVASNHPIVKGIKKNRVRKAG